MPANTSAPKARKPRPKPARTAQLHIRPEGDAPGAVELAVGKKAAAYLVTEIPADFGRGFAVEKIDGDGGDGGAVYHVNIGADTRTCECKGFLHHGHCKHVDGLAVLIAAGKL